MKARVKLSMTVVLTVEGKSEDSIMDWLSETTPQEALMLANHDVEDIDYEEEILCTVLSNKKADYDYAIGYLDGINGEYTKNKKLGDSNDYHRGNVRASTALGIAKNVKF